MDVQLPTLTDSLPEAEQFARLIVEHFPDSVKILDLDGRIQWMSESAHRILDTNDESAVGRWWIDTWVGAGRRSASTAFERAREGRTARFLGFRKTPRGQPKWWDVILKPLPDEDGEPGWILAIARDITQRRRSETYFRFLAGLDVLLNEQIDIESALESVGNEITRAAADVCVLDLVDDEGAVNRAMWSHRDPRRNDIMRQISEIAPHRGAQHPTTRVLRSRMSLLVPDVDETFIANSAVDEAHSQLWRDLGLRSLIAVPVMASGHMYGVLHLGVVANGRPFRFDTDDVALAEEVGRRLGVALENARRFRHELNVAQAFQEASLPRRLPRVDGIEFDSIYAPASDEATVGGDWYDAFVLPGGAIALTIGDVTGHGLEAATVMGRVRQAMRAAAVLHDDPAEMVRAADLTLKIEQENAIATAVAAVIDPTLRSITCAIAGHPAPIRRRADGTVADLPISPGVPLGLQSDGEASSETFALKSGDLIAFVTDGLLEIDRDLCAGEQQVRECIGKEAVYAAKAPAKALFKAMRQGGVQRDDIAVLTLRVP